ncbi:hypothetical protein PYV02_02530 [Leifsonia sp. H3M29-4]|uniref:hypothetical protein n=1 Tax=Salinibacterium metalliresistens TaxID=3031321 RepID=UPI0023D9C100|nr:hypothetical protein [Salinibacterium metalliresistens]MDF1477955.1 hypothetical protein [Salinibacterium metalliresistens]
MESPGQIEHVPLKVVPMYVEGENPDLEDADETEPPELPGVVARVRTPWVGRGALALAVATAVVHGIAVSVAGDGDPVTGTVLAYVAIGLSIAAVLGGLVAVIAGFGRRTGAAAIVLGVFANPVVLLTVLSWVQAVAS